MNTAAPWLSERKQLVGIVGIVTGYYFLSLPVSKTWYISEGNLRIIKLTKPKDYVFRFGYSWIQWIFSCVI